MKWLLLALALGPLGCIGIWPFKFPPDGERSGYAPRTEPRERSPVAAALTDAWIARVFDQPNRWKRSREVCADRPNDSICRALDRKHRKAERKERCGKKCRRRARKEARR